MIKNKFSFLLVSFTIILLVSACNGSAIPSVTLSPGEQTAVVQTLTAMAPTEPSATPTPTVTLTPKPSATPTKPQTSVGPDEFPEGVNPLTGLKVENPELLKRRPVLVKVSNYPAEGRPHAGLSYADIVFEYYIGGGSNRFNAIYYGQDCNKVGPVRSGRLVDPELTRMYQGVLAMSGANQENVFPRITELLGDRVITEGNCPGLCRDDYTVMGVFANTADITNVMKARGVEIDNPDLTGMLFDTAVPAGGEPAEKATLFYFDFNKGDWTYDSESGKYLRWIENAYNYSEMIPLVDRLTNEQLAFSNVIMAYANYTEYTSVLHAIGVWDNTEGNNAILFRDGQAYPIIWKTVDPDKPMVFLDAEGNPFPLKPGNTWINLIGNSSTLVKADGTWTFTFSMP